MIDRRMTCIYEPDDLTETRMELLAAVSTDSDLYLAKVKYFYFPDVERLFWNGEYLTLLCSGNIFVSFLVQMPGNCRNISDEVFPGIHVGDK